MYAHSITLFFCRRKVRDSHSWLQHIRFTDHKNMHIHTETLCSTHWYVHFNYKELTQPSTKASNLAFFYMYILLIFCVAY